MRTLTKEDFRIGIELECLAPYDTYDAVIEAIDEHYTIPYATGDDGSISGDGEGIEIRTEGALTYNKFTSTIDKLGDILSENRVSVNKTCGFHVHISTPSFFQRITIQRIIMLWVAIEDVLLVTQPPSRLNNQYCRRYIMQFLQDKRNNESLPAAKNDLIYRLGENNVQRYYTLNLSALEKHGTIEVRLHAGTIKPEKIRSWVNLLLHIYLYAINTYSHKEVLSLFKETISDEKIDRVFQMIALPKELTTYYKGRIQSNLFKTLQLQQEHAIKNFSLAKRLSKKRKQLEKEQAKIKRMDTQWTKSSDEIRKAVDQSVVDADF